MMNISEFRNIKDSGKIQNILNFISRKLNIPQMITIKNDTILSIYEDFEGELRGIYHGQHKDGSYVSYVNDESDSMLAIHELAHHVQSFGNSLTNTPHDSTYGTACNKIVRVLKIAGININTSVIRSV